GAANHHRAGRRGAGSGARAGPPLRLLRLGGDPAGGSAATRRRPGRGGGGARPTQARAQAPVRSVRRRRAGGRSASNQGGGSGLLVRVHLDTDFLIFALGSAGPERRRLLKLADSPALLQMSAVAWYEFARGPRLPEQLAVARSFFAADEGIIPL